MCEKSSWLNKIITRWIKSDLPEDRSSVLLLGVTKLQTSPLPTRRPSSLAVAVATDQSNNISGGHSARSSCSPRIIITHTSQRCNANNVITNKKHSLHDTWDDELLVGGDYPTTNGKITPPLCNSPERVGSYPMDKSVESIGTCSLDAEASVDVPDHSETSSLSTLKSISIFTASPEPHLPSYLSLACTVNGYSPITNYDSERLSKSRDASPHRLQEHEHLTATTTPTHRVQQNLLSPPNSVHFPTATVKPLENISEQAMEHHKQIYSTSETLRIVREVHSFSKTITSSAASETISKENGTFNKHSKFFKNETEIVSTNGQKCTSETIVQDFLNTKESKSFIQQRVERLYGPCALAQGFFVTKRQRSKHSESQSDKDLNVSTDDKHSQSLCDKFDESETTETTMKQSCSSPALPVLRHLRPEFRAQLPIIKTRKSVDGNLSKSTSEPKIADDAKIINQQQCLETPETAAIRGKDATNGIHKTELSVGKDGHYFLEICVKESSQLLHLADQTEIEAEQSDLPEEVKGKLRAAYGKARLLVSQKLEQFKGLCANNINQSKDEQFPTTNEDLQGFWDMVMLQIKDVYTLFDDIETLRKNNWQVLDEQPKTNGETNGSQKKLKKVQCTPRPTSAAAEAVRKQRDAARKQMMEARRKAMKTQKQPSQNTDIEIFMPESS